jgi:hypothetical protein
MSKNVKGFLVKKYFDTKLKRINDYLKKPVETQDVLLFSILEKAKETEFGRKYSFSEIKSIEDFQKEVPISSYEDLVPYIERMKKGERDILWPGLVKKFSKSSGTTNDRSKYIPISRESLKECHFSSGKDLFALFVKAKPDTEFLRGRSLIVGGSIEDDNTGTSIGDISALMTKHLPRWVHAMYRSPSLDVALLSDWEDKMDKIVEEAIESDIRSIIGVPSWTYLILKKAIEKTGKSVREIWPNLEVFFYGGVSIKPYRSLFLDLIPELEFFGVYNAADGFFGSQDFLSDKEDILLYLNSGIFYEFIPLSDLHTLSQTPKTIANVEMHTPYAMVISTNGGMWRYVIGDVVTFTSLKPHRIRITGRTKHFINICGEELMVENAEIAISKACEETNSKVKDFTAGPIFMDEDRKSGAHEWIVEFEIEPENKSEFISILDRELQKVNSDYESKRYKDLILREPKITFVPKKTFYYWMESRGKLGGQNKVPRLSNDRKYLESVYKYVI